jgi:hypothetical protein
MSLLISLLVLLLILAIVFWIIGLLPLPAPFTQIAQAIVLIVLLVFILQRFPLHL